MTNKLPYIAIAICFFFVGVMVVNLSNNNKQLGVNPKFAESSTVNKKISVTDPTVYSLSHHYVITLGVFRNEYLAKKLSKKYEDLSPKMKKIRINGERMTLVEVGPFSTYKETKKIKSQIVETNPELGNLVIKKRRI